MTFVLVVDPPALDYNTYEGDPPPETPKESEQGEDITKAADKLLRYASHACTSTCLVAVVTLTSYLRKCLLLARVLLLNNLHCACVEILMILEILLKHEDGS